MQQAWRKIDSLILHLLGLRKVAINSYIYISHLLAYRKDTNPKISPADEMAVILCTDHVCLKFTTHAHTEAERFSQLLKRQLNT